MLRFPAHRVFDLLFLALILSGAPIAVSYENESVPWSLRDRYTFDGAQGSFQFDVNTGEWKVDIAGAGTVIRDVQAEVVFADGRRLLVSGLHRLDEEREKFVNSYGAGTEFRSVFRTTDGLVIRYGVTRFRERPFLLIRMSLENAGERPVEVASMRPAVFTRYLDDKNGHGPKFTITRSSRRGRYPIVSPGSAICLVTLEYASASGAVGLGVLESGQARSTVEVSWREGSWAGAVECRFEPAITVNPGASLDADPVWVSYLLPRPSKVYEYFAWTQSAIPGADRGAELPANWVTVKGPSSAQLLYDAVRAWESDTIAHALVPEGWERASGSLKGRWPDYPHDMIEVSRQLVRLGAKPGISVDPLAVDARDANWLDPTNSAARAEAIDRMKSLVAAGFRFFVVRKSAIPDRVLKTFNLTRLQADNAAFEILAEATGGLPVLPAATMKLGGDIGEWERLLKSTKWYRGFNVVAAPVEVHLVGMKNLDAELIKAIGNYPGPLEITGMPEGKIRRQLSQLFESTAPDTSAPVPKSDRERTRRVRSSRNR